MSSVFICATDGGRNSFGRVGTSGEQGHVVDDQESSDDDTTVGDSRSAICVDDGCFNNTVVSGILPVIKSDAMDSLLLITVNDAESAGTSFNTDLHTNGTDSYISSNGKSYKYSL